MDCALRRGTRQVEAGELRTPTVRSTGKHNRVLVAMRNERRRRPRARHGNNHERRNKHAKRRQPTYPRPSAPLARHVHPHLFDAEHPGRQLRHHSISVLPYTSHPRRSCVRRGTLANARAADVSPGQAAAAGGRERPVDDDREVAAAVMVTKLLPIVAHSTVTGLVYGIESSTLAPRLLIDKASRA